MHVHSWCSPDGRMSEMAIIATCKKKGLDGVAITDHNTIKGALALKKIAPPNFVVIVGEEIQTREGEIMGYFLKEEIPPQLSIEETLERIKLQGGLVGIPHPFGSFRRSKIKASALERIINRVDFIEVFNSRNVFEKDDKMALILSQEMGLAPVVGSDGHLSCELAKAHVEIHNFDTPQQLLQNLHSAKFITKRSGLWVHFVTKCLKLANGFSFHS
ncbi:MAG: PHP domain-containing protein [Candidatus Hodarchaeota archaeon]